MSERILRIANGAGQFLEVYDDCVVIRREGMLQTLNGGRIGESRVTYKNISGLHVHYPEKSFFMSKNIGYVLLNVAGSDISGNTLEIANNPNAFTFGNADLIPLVRKAEQYIIEAMEKAKNPPVPSTQTIAMQIPVQVQPIEDPMAILEQLGKLAELKEQGVVSETEFEAKKRELLKKI